MDRCIGAGLISKVCQLRPHSVDSPSGRAPAYEPDLGVRLASGNISGEQEVNGSIIRGPVIGYLFFFALAASCCCCELYFFYDFFTLRRLGPKGPHHPFVQSFCKRGELERNNLCIPLMLFKLLWSAALN